MKEKSILFSTPEVQALLNTKPNTYPPEPIDASKPCKGMTRLVAKCACDCLDDKCFQYPKCPKPKYQVGDVLWVRETWSDFYAPETPFIYKADEDGVSDEFRWNPSSNMPRKAARLFLKVRGVRVERLQDITPEDAMCEGIKQRSCGEVIGIVDIGVTLTLIHDFRLLWDSINAKCGYGWETNPYVWVYSFERIEEEQK
ncbi:MAG: hypothetical protein Ta2A_12110 [Treponemataceae bacterium]|nr:MAG: hypothetical protein Ta2A_12110 [Treponemataceae bacterium]